MDFTFYRRCFIAVITCFAQDVSLLRFLFFIFSVLVAMIILITYSWYRVEKNVDQGLED